MVCFVSQWIVKSEAILTIVNQTTNEVFMFTLLGISEEPVAEDNIQLSAKAQSEVVLKVPIKNPMLKNAQFKVDCDIVDAILDQKLLLAPGEQTEFIIKYIPRIGGQQLNALTFTSVDDQYFWYLITQEIDPP